MPDATGISNEGIRDVSDKRSVPNTAPQAGNLPAPKVGSAKAETV